MFNFDLPHSPASGSPDAGNDDDLKNDDEDTRPALRHDDNQHGCTFPHF